MVGNNVEVMTFCITLRMRILIKIFYECEYALNGTANMTLDFKNGFQQKHAKTLKSEAN